MHVADQLPFYLHIKRKGHKDAHHQHQDEVYAYPAETDEH